MGKKKTSLPKEFRALVERADVEEIMAVFRDCDVNARGGYEKQTALAFDRLPDEVATWLVQNGADLAAADTWGNTPLHNRAGSRRSSIQVLLSLGANLRYLKKDQDGNTDRLAELAVKWVIQNPDPMKLDTQAYDR